MDPELIEEERRGLDYVKVHAELLPEDVARERARKSSEKLRRPMSAGTPLAVVLAQADEDGMFRTRDPRFGIEVSYDVSQLSEVADPDAVVNFSFRYRWRPEWIRERLAGGKGPTSGDG
jgi:hypothetical protein